VKALWPIVAALVVGLAAGGYAYHAARQKSEQHYALSALVDKATGEIKGALAGAPGSAELLRAQAALERLRAMDSSRHRAFADAVERYLISAHTIVRERGEAARLSRAAAADREALAAQLAARRSDAWFADTMAIKKRLEQEHFDLAHAYQALDQVLGSLGDDTRALAEFVPRSALVGEAQREDARRQARDDAGRAAQALEQARKSIEPR